MAYYPLYKAGASLISQYLVGTLMGTAAAFPITVPQATAR